MLAKGQNYLICSSCSIRDVMKQISKCKLIQETDTDNHFRDVLVSYNSLFARKRILLKDGENASFPHFRF